MAEKQANEKFTQPHPPASARLWRFEKARWHDEMVVKYKFYPLGKDGKRQSRDPIFALRLRVAFSWLERKFLNTPTKWVFEN